jgi:hypothetical protein
LRGTSEMRPLRAALVLRDGFVALARLTGDFDLLRTAGFLRATGFLCAAGRLRARAFELFRETGLVVRRAFVLPRPVFNPSPVRWLPLAGTGCPGLAFRAVLPGDCSKGFARSTHFFGEAAEKRRVEGATQRKILKRKHDNYIQNCEF